MAQLVTRSSVGTVGFSVGRIETTVEVQLAGTFHGRHTVTTTGWDREKRQETTEKKHVDFYGLASQIIPLLWPSGCVTDEDFALAARMADWPEDDLPTCNLAGFGLTDQQFASWQARAAQICAGTNKAATLVNEGDVKKLDKLLLDSKGLDRTNASDVSAFRKRAAAIECHVKPWGCTLTPPWTR